MADNLAVNIRAETSADLAAIHQIHLAAFPTSAEARLVDALRAAGRLSLSLVAEHRGAMVAHVAFSPVTLDEYPNLEGGLGLGPIAVVPDRQRQGVGSALMRAGLAASAAAGAAFVVVLGEPAYYGRFGFVPGTRFGLQNQYSAGDAFMALELNAGSLQALAGMVRYAPEFAAVEP